MSSARSSLLKVPRRIVSLIHQTLEAARQLSDHGRLLVEVDCLESTRGLMRSGTNWEDLLEVQVRGENEGAVRWYTEGLLEPLGVTPERYRDIGRAYARSIYGGGEYQHLLRNVSLLNVF